MSLGHLMDWKVYVPASITKISETTDVKVYNATNKIKMNQKN